METLYYKTLIAVAECGSFSLAAQRLHITQSTASRRIAFLEEHYGRILLDRDGVNLEPTSAGRLVIDQAKDILATENQIGVQLTRLEESDQIAFGCTANFGAIHLSRMLSHIAKKELFPHVRATTSVTDELIEGLGEGRYDVAFLEHCGLGVLAEFSTCELSRDEVVFLSAHAGLPAGEIDISALLPCQIFVCPTCCCTRKLLDKNLEREGLQVTDFAAVIDLGDIHVMQRALAEQGGVAFLSRELAATALASGLFTAHTIPGWTHHRRRTVVARSQEMADSWCSLFRDSLLA